VIAVPIRRCVAPAAIASAKSPDIPADIHVGIRHDAAHRSAHPRSRANAAAGASREGRRP
jgi:hypothetical protein